MKGRIDHAANIRENACHAERIYTAAFEYDRINLPNLVLKAAVEASARFAPSAFSRGRARNAGLSFADWPHRKILPADFHSIRLDRQTERYRTALRLARLILGRQNPDIAHGRERVFSLLFDMNDLWEAAISARLRHECSGKNLAVRTQRSKVFWRSDAGFVRTIRPDIVIEDSDGRKVIVDAKWKALRRPVPGDDDLKQIFAYDVMWDTTEGFLLYPEVDGSESTGGAYRKLVGGSERHCGVLYAEVDPASWPSRPLLQCMGLPGGAGQSG